MEKPKRTPLDSSECINRLKMLDSWQAGYVILRTGRMWGNTNQEILNELTRIIGLKKNKGDFETNDLKEMWEKLGLQDTDFKRGGKNSERYTLLREWYKPVLDHYAVSEQYIKTWPNDSYVQTVFNLPTVQAPLPPVEMEPPPVVTLPPVQPVSQPVPVQAAPQATPPVQTVSQAAPQPVNTQPSYNSPARTQVAPPVSTPVKRKKVDYSKVLTNVGTPKKIFPKQGWRIIFFPLRWGCQAVILYVLICLTIVYGIPRVTNVYPHRDFFLYDWYYKVFPELWPYDYADGYYDAWMFGHLNYSLKYAPTPKPGGIRVIAPYGYEDAGLLTAGSVNDFCRNHGWYEASQYHERWSCTGLNRILRKSELIQICALTRPKGDYLAQERIAGDMYSTTCFRKTSPYVPSYRPVNLPPFLEKVIKAVTPYIIPK